MNRYSAYFAIEKKIKDYGHPIERGELISSFTKGRKSSLKDLTQLEYLALLDYMRTKLASISSRSDWQNSPENVMRRKIISLFRKMGYEKGGKADMKSINGWAYKYGHAHKYLNRYTYEELPKLVSQAEETYESYLKSTT